MPYPIAHALIPGFIASKTTQQKKLWLLAALIGMLPDIDGVYILYNYQLYETLHRVVFHSLIIGFLISLFLMFVLKAKNNTERLTIFTVSLLAFYSHLLLDLIFSNAGVYIFTPFSMYEVSFTILQLYPTWLFDITIIIIILLICGAKQLTK